MDYVRVETAAGGIHLYPLPATSDEARAELVDQLRAAHGIPTDWVGHPDRGAPTVRTPAGQLLPPAGNGWDVAIVSGPLHPALIAIATVHDRIEEGP